MNAHKPSCNGPQASGLALAALLATGCATVSPRPTQAPLTVPPAWQQGAGASTATAGQELVEWWKQFGDPQLSDLVSRALMANPDLESARARLRESRARVGLTKKDLLPSVDGTLSGNGSKRGDAGTQQQYAASLDASWEPDVFGGTRKAVTAAQADAEASEASLRDAQVSLAAEVALGCVALRSYQARIAIARDSLETQSETLELTRWRAEAGLTSSLDVEQSRSSVEQTRAAIPNLRTALAETENRLAILLGVAPGTLHDELTDVRAVPAPPVLLAVGIPADTLRQRPDVRASERQLAAAIARLGQARAARYPSLRLSGSLGLEALTPGGVFGGGALVRSLLGSLTGPLFDRGRIYRQIEIQDAQVEQARASHERSVLTALEDVENALVALANERERHAALADAAEAARSAALLARQRYTAGLADFQSALDTQRSALVIEESLHVSEADTASSVIRLYKALGGGWSPEADQPARTGVRSEES
jgi:NodT family efflux transporter outer membrane factor (OMF) lipoprotein